MDEMEDSKWFLDDGNVVLRLKQGIVPADEEEEDDEGDETGRGSVTSPRSARASSPRPAPGSTVLFCLHKSIVSMASGVFSDMFKHSSEKGQGSGSGSRYKGLPVVECPDQDPAGFGIVLSFIYPVASRPTLTVSVCSTLLYAADRYEIPSLRVIAEQGLLTPPAAAGAGEAGGKEPLLHGDPFRSAALGRRFNLERVWTTASSVILQQAFRKIGMDQVACLSSQTLLELVWMRERQQERWLKFYSSPPAFEHACGSERTACVAIFDKEWHGAFWRQRLINTTGSGRARPGAATAGALMVDGNVVRTANAVPETTIGAGVGVGMGASPGAAALGSVNTTTTTTVSHLSHELSQSCNGVLLPNKRFWAEIMSSVEGFPLKSMACRIKASQAVAQLQEAYSGC